MNNKIVLIGALPSSLINFRGELLKTLVANNYEVIAVASGASINEVKEIEQLGVKYINIAIERNTINILSDLRALYNFYKLFKREKPAKILAYTIKPIIWGGLAARLAKIKSFNALITGLGYAFQKGDSKRYFISAFVKLLYKFALSGAQNVIFQNPDNRQVFIDFRIIPKYKTSVVNGSGVDLSHFEVKPLPSSIRFLLIARLLGDKGIREYIHAANIVKMERPYVEFDLVGPEDPSPDGISLKELAEINSKNSVNYLGETNDVRPHLDACVIFVLPSYHEGLPRTVLEAMATGRPILTTDVPGCRETVVNGMNGWLINKGNAGQLSEKMIWFIENQSEWQRMADASRAIVEHKFDVHKVNTELLRIMDLN